MKNLVAIVAVILFLGVIGVIGFVVLNNNTPATSNNVVTNAQPTPVPAPTSNSDDLGTINSDTIVVVSIKDMSFPVVTTIKKGQIVKWTNDDGLVHTVTFNDINANSGTITPGGTYDHKFDDAGSFTYHCNFHPNMVATIVVE
ncbi:MAG: cupredoxin domain-containing protein [Candidatus Dojkabacteria bacterium]